MRPGDEERGDDDEGGEPPCFAHLLELDDGEAAELDPPQDEDPPVLA